MVSDVKDENLRAAWERHAEEWIAWARTPALDESSWQLNLSTLSELLPRPGHLTLDVGCGEGRLLRVLAARGHRVLGIDASPTLARAVRTHPQPQPVVIADAVRLPLADGAADLAVAHMSLQDVDDLEGAVGEIARVLRPRGRLCAAVVHPLNSAGTFTGDEPDAAFVIDGSYLGTRRYAETVDKVGQSMTFHSQHRTVEVYSLARERAGLLIEALREPAHQDRWVTEDPARVRWQRIPLFLHLRAVKPG